MSKLRERVRWFVREVRGNALWDLTKGIGAAVRGLVVTALYALYAWWSTTPFQLRWAIGLFLCAGLLHLAGQMIEKKRAAKDVPLDAPNPPAPATLAEAAMPSTMAPPVPHGPARPYLAEPIVTPSRFGQEHRHLAEQKWQALSPKAQEAVKHLLHNGRLGFPHLQQLGISHAALMEGHNEGLLSRLQERNQHEQWEVARAFEPDLREIVF